MIDGNVIIDEKAKVTFVNDGHNHLVAIVRPLKLVLGLFIASPGRSVGSTFTVQRAEFKKIEECPPKFYKSYGIAEISPYESDWRYVELDFNTLVTTGDESFTTIPNSRKEIHKSAVASVIVGSKWRSKNVTWVVVDKTEENLAGRHRARIWIETEDGRRGQAVYADSIAGKFKFISA